MLLHAFFDESGSHDDAELTAVAGYLANDDQWLAFQARTQSLFQKWSVTSFHAVEVRRGSGDFRGWTVDQKIEFLDEFQHIINEELPFGIATFVFNADYDHYLSRHWPEKIRKDTKYAILFRACIAHALQLLGEHYSQAEPQLRTVFESGHKHAGDAQRCYAWICDAHQDAEKVLVGLSFEDKRGSLPLAAADLLAYTVWGIESGRKPIGEARQTLKSPVSYTKNISRIFINKTVLAELHAQALKLNVK